MGVDYWYLQPQPQREDLPEQMYDWAVAFEERRPARYIDNEGADETWVERLVPCGDRADAERVYRTDSAEPVPEHLRGFRILRRRTMPWEIFHA